MIEDYALVTLLRQIIDSYFIINATRNIATMGVVSPDTPDVMVQTLIVDEVVSMMNVEEFKDIAPYFLF